MCPDSKSLDYSSSFLFERATSQVIPQAMPWDDRWIATTGGGIGSGDRRRNGKLVPPRDAHALRRSNSSGPTGIGDECIRTGSK